MIDSVLRLLTVHSADVFIVLFAFSLILHTTRILQLAIEGHYNFRQAIIHYLQLFQRFIAYYLMIVLGNIANRFVTTRLPLEAVPYLIEITALLRIIATIFNDGLIRITVSNFIDILNSKTQLKVPETPEEQTKESQSKSASENHKREDS